MLLIKAFMALHIFAYSKSIYLNVSKLYIKLETIGIFLLYDIWYTALVCVSLVLIYQCRYRNSSTYLGVHSYYDS